MSEQEKKVARKIIGEYEEKRETALDALKRTHAKAQKPALIFAYAWLSPRAFHTAFASSNKASTAFCSMATSNNASP